MICSTRKKKITWSIESGDETQKLYPIISSFSLKKFYFRTAVGGQGSNINTQILWEGSRSLICTLARRGCQVVSN